LSFLLVLSPCPQILVPFSQVDANGLC
jgi:hypothetical protein